MERKEVVASLVPENQQVIYSLDTRRPFDSCGDSSAGRLLSVLHNPKTGKSPFWSSLQLQNPADQWRLLWSEHSCSCSELEQPLAKIAALGFK